MLSVSSCSTVSTKPIEASKALGCPPKYEDTTDALRDPDDGESDTSFETYLIGAWKILKTKHVGEVQCVHDYENRK